MAKKLNPNYISFHNHAIGSLRDGIMSVSDHVNFAVQNNKKHVCITDHGSISEWIELYNQCKKNDLIPIYGVEGYVHIDRDWYLENKEGKTNHVVLLAQNETGFKNIIKIHNDAWREEHFYRKPIMSYDVIEQYSEGVILGSACLGGTLPRYLANDQIEEADDFIIRMKSIFKDRFYIELMFIEYDEQIDMNRKLLQIARKHDVPFLINTDAHYSDPADNKAHQLSLLLQSGQTVKDLEQGKGWSFSAQDMHMKTEKDLYRFWVDHYQNDPVITKDVLYEATWNVDKITNSIEEIYLEYPPRIPSPKDKDGNPIDGSKMLKKMAVNGLIEKFELGLVNEEKQQEYIDRLEYELQTIENLELVDYFLLIKHIVDWCNDNEIAVGAGRGSVSASLVTWVIGITKLDPIRWNFIFERFLNPARKTRLKIFSQ